MPPKKAAKKGGKKGKKGKKGASEEDAWTTFLNDMFFVSTLSREEHCKVLRKQIKQGFQIFQDVNRPGFADVRELGALVRYLSLNPTKMQLKLIQEQVEDPDTGSQVVYEKFEKLMLQLLITHELKYKITNPDGTTREESELVVRESDEMILKAYDKLWEASGRCTDTDKNNFIEGDRFREELCQERANAEQFDDNEVTEFMQANADPESGHVKEEVFMMLQVE